MTYRGSTECMRCGKDILHPNAANADYIMASEFIVKEPRNVFIALKHNKETKDKLAADPGAIIDDKELDAVEIPEVASALLMPDVVKVVAEIKEKDIQKSAVICPDCYNPDTDFVIWGVHKEANS